MNKATNATKATKANKAETDRTAVYRIPRTLAIHWWQLPIGVLFRHSGHASDHRKSRRYGVKKPALLYPMHSHLLHRMKDRMAPNRDFVRKNDGWHPHATKQAKGVTVTLKVDLHFVCRQSRSHLVHELKRIGYMPQHGNRTNEATRPGTPSTCMYCMY